MSARTAPNRSPQQGFSLVELMVAMTLSLILMAGVLSMVYSSKVAYLENERVARNQENGRAAFDMILRDLRGAGFPGCSQPVAGIFTPVNQLKNNTSLLWQLDMPLQGYEGTSGTWSPALDAVLTAANPTAGNDILVIRTTRAGVAQFNTPTDTFTSGTDDITVNKTATQKVEGQTFVINDCQGEVFFAAAVTDNGTTATLQRTTTGTPTNSSATLPTQFHGGALVAPVDTIVYFIAPSADSAVANSGTLETSLWRIVGSLNSGQPQELIPGVERMEVQYGLDTDNNYIVDKYVNADAVKVAGVTDWTNVISVKVAILVRSPQANSPDTDLKTYTLLGNTVGPFKDHYERSVFTTTVALRNRTF